MTLTELAERLRAQPEEVTRRRLILEFVEEYRWEPPDRKPRLLDVPPPYTGSRRYDAFLAALAEHLAYHDGLAVPGWTQDATLVLDQWWFPIDLPSVRADAIVHSPAAFRSRGIFIGTGSLDRA